MCVSGRETAERTGHGQRGRPVRVALRCDRTCRNRGVVECGWEVGCSPYLPSILDRSGSTLHRPHRSIHGPIAAHEQEQTQRQAQSAARERPDGRLSAARTTRYHGATPRPLPSAPRHAQLPIMHTSRTALSTAQGATRTEGSRGRPDGRRGPAQRPNRARCRPRRSSTPGFDPRLDSGSRVPGIAAVTGGFDAEESRMVSSSDQSERQG